jgi:hypothetical protein
VKRSSFSARAGETAREAPDRRGLHFARGSADGRLR